MKIICK